MKALRAALQRLRNGALRALLALAGRLWRPSAAEAVDRIVVLEMTRLGDLIAATALLAPLARAYPGARIELLGAEAYAPLFEGEGPPFIALPPAGAPFLRAAWARRRELRGPGLLLVSASPSVRNTLLALLSRPGRACGYLFPRAGRWMEYDPPAPLQARGGGWNADGGLPKGLHMVQRAALALTVAGIAADGLSPRLASGAARAPRRVLLHAGANWARRRWPLARFVQLGASLAQAGCDCVLIAAEAGDPGPLPPGLRLAEPVGLAGLKDQLASASLFVGNDSGPLHLAAALGTPCLGLFGPNLAERSGPWPLPGSAGSPHQVLHEDVPCRPCDQLLCVQPWDWCMEKLPVDRVVQAALGMLAR